MMWHDSGKPYLTGVEENYCKEFAFASDCKEFAFASAAPETVRTGTGVGE
jgi:hypothetical protein